MKLSQTYFAATNTLSIFLLLIIWVLPGTIALRNILLSLAALSGLGIICFNWGLFNSFRAKLIPIYAVFSLFLWVLIHYIFFSINPELEFSEIKSLWLRTLASSIAALGFSIVFCRTSSSRKYFYIGILSVPLINIASYFYASFLHGGFLRSSGFIFFLFAKIETAFFGAVGGVIVISDFIYRFIYEDKKLNYRYVGFCILILTLIIVSDLLSATMNGLLIIIYLCFLLLLLMSLKSYRKLKENIKQHTFGAIFVSIALAFILLTIYKPVFIQLNHYYQDVKIGFNIDENDEWRILHGEGFQPVNSLGKPVTLNIYYRSAFAAKGIRLINQYPLGYGSINESFNRLQNLEGGLHFHEGQVHSGWIDFGLAFGIPGLALIFISLFGTLYSAFFLKTREGILAVFFCITLIPFGLVSELTYKQYFEMLIFFITFAGGLAYLQSNTSRQHLLKCS